MRATTTALFFALWVFSSFGQELASSMNGIALLGAKKIDNQLLLLNRTDRNKVTLAAVSEDGKQNWEMSFNVASIGGYNFNQIQLIGDSQTIFLVQQLTAKTILTKLDPASGEIKDQFDIVLETGESPKQWTVQDGEAILIETKEGALFKYSLTDDDQLEAHELLEMPQKYVETSYKVGYCNDGVVYTTSRKLEPNHGLVHLYLSKYDLTTGDTLEKPIDLELAHTSFTYNSSVDKEIFGVVPSSSGFYLVGKLDIAFQRKYPTAKVGDNFIGFWVAKFNEDLTLEYFSEIPFQYLDHIVPADVIQKPTVIELKEDVNGGVFINLNELQGVIYGSKYFVYLNSDGEIGMAKGGNDEYHFMEYDRTGLRNAGRKNHLRMMDDDWTSFSTDPFLYISPKQDMYSETANRLLVLITKQQWVQRMDKSYNFFKMDNKTLFLEHFAKKKGTLYIYTD